MLLPEEGQMSRALPGSPFISGHLRRGHFQGDRVLRKTSWLNCRDITIVGVARSIPRNDCRPPQ